MSGYAVVDVETTGLFPGKHDRIVEIAIVEVSVDGQLTSRVATYPSAVSAGTRDCRRGSAPSAPMRSSWKSHDQRRNRR